MAAILQSGPRQRQVGNDVACNEPFGAEPFSGKSSCASVQSDGRRRRHKRFRTTRQQRANYSAEHVAGTRCRQTGRSAGTDRNDSARATDQRIHALKDHDRVGSLGGRPDLRQALFADLLGAAVQQPRELAFVRRQTGRLFSRPQLPQLASERI